MARAKRTIKTTSITKTRVSKNSGGKNASIKQCNVCHGTGVVFKSSGRKWKTVIYHEQK